MKAVARLAILGGPKSIAQSFDRSASSPVTIRRGDRRVLSLESALSASSGSTHAVACSSGSAGLHAALLLEGVMAGDEVVVPPLVCMAVVNVLLMAGMRPVFADVLPMTLSLDPAAVEASISPRTRAIISVHQYGIPASVELGSLARRTGVPLIGDYAEAPGLVLKGAHDGCATKESAKVLSFGVGKLIDAGGGGALLVETSEAANELRRIIAYGFDEAETPARVGANYLANSGESGRALFLLQRFGRLSDRLRSGRRVVSEALAGLPVTLVQGMNVDEVLSRSFVLLLPSELRRLRAQALAALLAEGLDASAPFVVLPEDRLFVRETAQTPSNLAVARDLAQRALLVRAHSVNGRQFESIALALQKVFSQLGELRRLAPVCQVVHAHW